MANIMVLPTRLMSVFSSAVSSSATHRTRSPATGTAATAAAGTGGAGKPARKSNRTRPTWKTKKSAPKKSTKKHKKNSATKTATKRPQQMSPLRLLNNKLDLDKHSTPFYYGLAPTSRRKLQKSLHTCHDEKPYITMRKLHVGPSAVPEVRAHGGRGVFAGETFAKGDVVEICPLLLDTDKNWESPQANEVAEHENYTISWDCNWYAVKEVGVAPSPPVEGSKKGSKKTLAPGKGSRKAPNKAVAVHSSKGPFAPGAHEEFCFVPAKIAQNKRSPYHTPPRSAIMLGYGSLYNHARKNSNVEWEFGADGTVCFVATKSVAEGEELLVDYGDAYWLDMLGKVPDS